MQAASTQRLVDHRGVATATLAIGIFVSGLALGATLAINASQHSNAASVTSPAFDPGSSSLQQHRASETSLGTSNRVAGPSFDGAHHLRLAPPSLTGDAAIKAVRDQRQGEFGVGGP